MSGPPVLLIPGLWNSGPDHWQSHWERAHPRCQRLQQRDWETPRCAEWVSALEQAVAALGPATVLVAHSLGCATVAHWARHTRQRVRGALLVAPSDVEARAYPPGTEGFAPMPLERLPFPAIVVVSENDEYVAPTRARQFAAAWGGEPVSVGRAGHINSASRLGPWPEGWALVQRLVEDS